MIKLIRLANMPKILLFISFIFILLSPTAIAGDTLLFSQDQKIEQNRTLLRQPDKLFFKKYLNDKKYNYGSDYNEPEGMSFFERLWNFLTYFIRKSLKLVSSLPLLLKIIFYLACIILLYVIITKTRFYKILYTDKEVETLQFFETDTSDSNFNFERAIEQLVLKQNFREAIRILHLKMLKDLESQSIIKYTKDKTNREYAREIQDTKIRHTFNDLTSIFNSVWYGNQNLSKVQYDNFANEFEQFTYIINVAKQ